MLYPQSWLILYSLPLPHPQSSFEKRHLPCNLLPFHLYFSYDKRVS
ncbi:hypothetical protein EVA_07690 [gut metagenome]|uniref:Uncharacterized protein n=1 Tax=gut metagenome TaxID=749906 RepID=J9GP99_9ZZZZ